MKNRAFHFEIKDLLTQFVAAFDDAVISRYNKSRERQNNIEVRYVFAPKQRVLYDILNKAQNLTLPVVAINLTGVTRDESRVFNKLAPSYLPAQKIEDPNAASKFLMPVPVNLEVSMSILARYMQDVDQIVSNFVPYNNPYIILSWKVPSDFGAQYDQEIRSEVLWSGDLAYTTPTETTYNEHYRIAVDTSFTIKGWLFPEQNDTIGSIYKIDNNFVSVDLANRIYSPDEVTNRVTEYITYQQQGYGALSGYDSTVTGLTSNTETITVSAIPEFTNIFYTTTGTFTQIRSTTTILTSHDNNFMLYGKRFTDSDFYLSANNLHFFPKSSVYQEITSAKNPTISGYTLDSSFYNIASDNVVSIFLPTSTLSASGKFTFIAANEAGWGTSYQASSSILNIT